MSALERITAVEGDITIELVDAIVNAANTTLLGGGGVDGAIHREAGPDLLAECRTLNGCPTGQARITKGYNLAALWVIHTVGPVWSWGHKGEDAKLASCYQSCLKIAKEHGLKSIAFPAISTGIYRFPLERATRIAINEIRNHLQSNATLTSVRLVCFDGETLATYQRIIYETLP